MQARGPCIFWTSCPLFVSSCSNRDAFFGTAKMPVANSKKFDCLCLSWCSHLLTSAVGGVTPCVHCYGWWRDPIIEGGRWGLCSPMMSFFVRCGLRKKQGGRCAHNLPELHHKFTETSGLLGPGFPYTITFWIVLLM